MSNPVRLYRHFERPKIKEHVERTIFNHPGYSFPHGILLVLSRLESSDLTFKRGVHYGTALTACKIIANNAVNGYLTTDQEGRKRLNLGPNDILTGSEYWFFAGPELGDNYPVVPSFRDWEFPHESPIVNWPRSITETNDRECIVTQTAAMVNMTHLIPAEDEEWFRKNGMHRYIGGTGQDINKPENQITLRDDLCRAFEDGWFTIVPKKNDYVVHQLDAPTTDTKQFATSYLNRMIYVPAFTAPELLFACFARAVLTRAQRYIDPPPILRHVARYGVADDEGAEDEGQNDPASRPSKTKLEWLTPLKLSKQYGSGGGKDNDESDPASSNIESDAAQDGDEENIKPLVEGDSGQSRKRQRVDSPKR